MKKQVLFIQGGGDDGYHAAVKMVDSLKAALGNDYALSYPELPSDENRSDFGWPGEIGKEINKIKRAVILVGHSLGASLILKYLSEEKVSKEISGLFLIAPPFWSGNADWVQGLKLQFDFADKLPRNIPIFFYHCMDDEVVPFGHLAAYIQKLPFATVREIKKGGHLLNNDLKLVAEDIMQL